MSLQAMINAARSGNAVEFEKSFQAEAKNRVNEALAGVRAGVVASMLGLKEATAGKTDQNLDNEEDNSEDND